MAVEKKLFSITWPIFVEMILFMLLGSIDIFMLGKYSDNSVAAVGIVNQIMGMINLVFGVITTGTMIICAQYIGAKKDRKDVIRLSGASLGLNVVLGVTVSLGLVVFRSALLKIMNVAPELMDYSTDYINIVGGFMFVQAIVSTFTAILRSHGATKVCMYVAMGMNLFNVISNYTLIFGNFGAPELGVSGAAISTVVSKCLATVVLGYYLFKYVLNDIKLKYFKTLPKNEIKNIIRLGAPAAGEQISYQLAKMVGTIILTYISIDAITTNNYVNNIVMFVMVFAVSMGQGTAIIVGRLIGEGENDRAYKLCISSFKKAFVVSTVMGIVIASCGKHIFGLFTDNAEIISLGVAVLMIDVILEPGRVFNVVIINSLRAVGDVKFPVYIGICSMWLFGVGLAYVLSIPMGLGLVGMWIGLALDEWIRGIIMYRRWKSRKWEGKAVVLS